MSTIFMGRDGELRLYDGTGTPFYVALPFVNMNLNAPVGRTRPTETLTQTVGTYEYRPESPAAMLAPLDLSFALRLEHDTSDKNRQAFGVDYAAAAAAVTTWLVDGDTWVSTYGSSTIYDHDGVALVRPTAFSDTRKVCTNVEGIWTSPSGNIEGWQWSEVYFDPAGLRINESPDGVTLSATGLIYGAISPISGFTAGNQS